MIIGVLHRRNDFRFSNCCQCVGRVRAAWSPGAAIAAHLKRDGGVYADYSATCRTAAEAWAGAGTVYLRAHGLLTQAEEKALAAKSKPTL